MLNIQQAPDSSKPFALFNLAFRAFFLLGPLVAILGLMMWIFHYAGWLLNENYWGASTYHSHEMIFGFAVAIIAGFLLTAARNWTGLAVVSGWKLAGLVLIWLLGRILPWLSVPGSWVALVDLLFLPLVMITLAIPVIKVRQWRNIIFIPILSLLWLGNLLMHRQQLGLSAMGAHAGLYLGVDVIILLIIVMGGRVIPMFSGNGIGEKIARTPQLDRLMIATGLIYLIAHQFGFMGWTLAIAALLAFITHSIRLIIWYRAKIWGVPLVWILQISYGWIILGFLLMSLAALGYLSPFLALHAFTVGGISGMILGMISRVSLGHTGRPLLPPTLVVISFFILQFAAFVRVIIPILLPQMLSAAVIVSGFLWMLAFLGFVLSYGKMLVKPRIDGLPG